MFDPIQLYTFVLINYEQYSQILEIVFYFNNNCVETRVATFFMKLSSPGFSYLCIETAVRNVRGLHSTFIL
jgi:hypothetical protein